MRICMRTKPLLAAVILALVAGLGFMLYRGFGPVPAAAQCTTKVGDVTVSLEPDQARNATIIAAIGVRRGLPARAVSIALATAMQESKLHNLDYGDRDSLGLFQQRPSQGWGTQKQVQNPYYATNAFYDVLAKIEGFESMKITDAAQKVQRSAFPDAYQAHATDARAMASAMTGYSPGGTFSCVSEGSTESGSQATVARGLTRAYGKIETRNDGDSALIVPVDKGADGARLAWSIAAFAVAHADRLGIDAVSFDGHTWSNGADSSRGWQADKSASAGQLRLKLH
jgi:hypothetical protein